MNQTEKLLSSKSLIFVSLASIIKATGTGILSGLALLG